MTFGEAGSFPIPGVTLPTAACGVSVQTNGDRDALSLCSARLLRMTLASTIGSFPGDSAQEYAEWVRISLSSLSLPALPELPGRGATASMTGRGVAVMAELGADLQPAGWRLTDASGVDHRRARSLLAQDLDALEELGQDYDGPLKVQVAGPWTLAATVERPRGDKVLADHGARRELAQALAEGVAGHVQDVRRRMAGVSRLVVQVDEPALPAVLGGKIPTASGFGRHRSVDSPEASEALGWVLSAVTQAGAEPWVHCCAAEAPLGLIRGAGAVGLAVDPSLVEAAGLDVMAETLEAGDALALGVVPSTAPVPQPGDDQATVQVERWLDMVGLEPGSGLIVTPACGVAGATGQWARRAIELVAASARSLS